MADLYFNAEIQPQVRGFSTIFTSPELDRPAQVSLSAVDERQNPPAITTGAQVDFAPGTAVKIGVGMLPMAAQTFTVMLNVTVGGVTTNYDCGKHVTRDALEVLGGKHEGDQAVAGSFLQYLQDELRGLPQDQRAPVLRCVRRAALAWRNSARASERAVIEEAYNAKREALADIPLV